VDAIVGHDQIITVPRKFVLQQLDEIILVIHDQDPRHHADNLARPVPNAKTVGLQPRDEMETEKLFSAENFGTDCTDWRGLNLDKMNWKFNVPNIKSKLQKVFSEDWLQLQGNRYSSYPKYQWPKPFFIATDESFRAIRDDVERLISDLPCDSQKSAIAKLRSDEQFWETYHELAVGNLLRNLGLKTEYENQLNGLTPDWLVSTSDGSEKFIVEVFTQNVSASDKAEDKQMADLTNRLKQIPIDVFISIDVDLALRKEKLTSQRVKKVFNSVKQWLEKQKTNFQPEFSVDEFSFLIRLKNVGYSSLQYGYGLQSITTPESLRANLVKKFYKYRFLAEANKLPLLIAVVPGLETRHQFGDTEMNWIFYGESQKPIVVSKGLFADKPLFSGAILANWQSPGQWLMQSYLNPLAKFPLPASIFTSGR